jgi:hypothetical protein
MPHLAHYLAPFADTPDHLLNGALIIGALAGAVAVVVGGIFTARYGRRASVSICAESQRTPTSCAIVVRPSVKAVGVFKVKFKHCIVKVSEVQKGSDGEYVSVENGIEHVENVFKNSYVDGGEDLQTSIFVPVPLPQSNVVAWAVRFELEAAPRFSRWLPPRRLAGRLSNAEILPKRVRKSLADVSKRTFYWHDTVFVPVTADGS